MCVAREFEKWKGRSGECCQVCEEACCSSSQSFLVLRDLEKASLILRFGFFSCHRYLFLFVATFLLNFAIVIFKT